MLCVITNMCIKSIDQPQPIVVLSFAEDIILIVGTTFYISYVIVIERHIAPRKELNWK